MSTSTAQWRKEREQAYLPCETCGTWVIHGFSHEEPVESDPSIVNDVYRCGACGTMRTWGQGYPVEHRLQQKRASKQRRKSPVILAR